MKQTANQTNKHPVRLYFQVFIEGVLLYLIAVLPFLIYHGGIFFYYGDYNVQQVPFYVLAGRAVDAGNLFWNPNVDLGSSMGGTFAFYLWGSPYFWFSTLFKPEHTPYLLPLFMALKYGTAMTTSFAYARRHVKTQAAAHMAALLYAFSGFAANNIVFQHFHEGIAFFPLYLLVFDNLVEDMRGLRSGETASLATNTADPTAVSGAKQEEASEADEKTPNPGKRILRSGAWFALMTCFMSILNYYFFYGSVVFIIVYYFVRYVACSGKLGRDGDACSGKLGFLQVASEIVRIIGFGLVGLLGAAFFLIQVYDILAGNTRLDNYILGYDMLVYPDATTPLAIVKSMFMIPDLVGRGTLFTNDAIKNSAPSLFLPLFSLSGVIAYFRLRKGQKDWKKTLLVVSAIIAFVPVFNAAFSMFNASYYSRWFYMPILFMSIVTATALEEKAGKELRFGSLVCTGIFAILVLSSMLPTMDEDGNVVWFSIMEYPMLFIVEAVVTAVIVILLFTCLWFIPMGRAQKLLIAQGQNTAEEMYLHGPLLTRSTAILTVIACLLTTMGVLYNGTSLIAHSGGEKWQQQMLTNVPEIPATGNANAAVRPGENGTPWFRVETDGSSTNYEMVWGYPTIHCFQSTVTPGIFDFYHGIGFNRTVDSKLGFYRAGARALLSERYHFENDIIHIEKNFTSEGGIVGYEKIGNSDGYNIYENQHFIPMGFTFDQFITEDRFETISSDNAKDRYLVRDLILSKEDALRYAHLFEAEDLDVTPVVPTNDQFFSDCDDRAASACQYFAWTKNGFEAQSNYENMELVFFSVPYDTGWSATVDGVETEIIKADYGLMAVAVPAGTHDISFTYLPAYLKPAIFVSICAGFLMILMFIFSRNTK